MTTAAQLTEILDRIDTRLYIGGEWCDSSSGQTLAVENPATGEVVAHVADATPEDGKAALDAAVASAEEWGRTAPRTRSDILRRAYELVTARADEFALVMTTEMGKPLAEARGEVTYAAEYLRWFSEEAVRVAGQYGSSPEGKTRVLTVKKPVGPVLLITPWNFPLAMATRKIGPALAAGCPVVIKPAQLTPLTMHMFFGVLEEAGVPAGVVNLITTSHAGAVTGPLIADSRLRKLSFTGSTEVGRRLLSDASQNVLRTSMELGGNAPFLVFDDADLDAAVDGAMIAKLRNMGEACTAANRFYVHESVAAEFATKLGARVGALTVGDGAASGTDIGPLVEAKARDKVEELVGDAISRGARVEVGGAAVDGPGYFYEPTVLVDVPADARVNREEIFGPVAPIITFSTEDEAVQLANSTEFGLMAYVYTRDSARGLRLAERLETGMLGLNTGLVSNAAAPFGGVKQSGLGREGGREGIEEYLAMTYVGIADPFGA